jgi:hypothetical protein
VGLDRTGLSPQPSCWTGRENAAGTLKEHRKRSGSVAKCDDPREAVGPAVLSESAALSQVETKQKVSRHGVESLW